MAQSGPQHFTTRFGPLRDALAEMMGIPAHADGEALEITKARGALSDRLANLKRLHFPPGVNVTKAAKAVYSATAIASLAVAAHLENMHLNPRVVIAALSGNETQVWRFTAASLSCADDRPAGYGPAGSLLLLFEPSGLDDLGTRAARAGRYDAPPSPARIVHFDHNGGARVHGISVDAAVLGASLAAGLKAVGLDATSIVGDLWHKVEKRRPGQPGGLLGYKADAESLLRILGQHGSHQPWEGDEILTALVLLNSMAAAGPNAEPFANAVVNPDFSLVTFNTVLQTYMDRIGLPVSATRSQPESIGLNEIRPALKLVTHTDIVHWLQQQLKLSA